MGLVDAVMLGPLGPAALGAGTLGTMIFYTVAICGTGLLLGLDTLVAQAYGAGDLEECRRSLASGIWLGTLLAPVTIGVSLACLPLLRWYGINAHVYQQLTAFVTALVWSIIPLFLYAALRRYLQAVHVVKPVTFAIVSANLINFAGNWLLIYGHWGAPAMGIRGSAWSTCLARAWMALVLLYATARHGGFRGVEWRPHWERLRKLFRLGLPAAAQIGFEAAGFALVTAMAAKLDEASLAAHSIALNVISVTYMVPLGISSAAAVRAGHAKGRGDARGVAAAGWAALLLSALFMSGAGIVLFTLPAWIVRAYSHDPQVIRLGVMLLGIAALFELGDGAQVVATGALRGIGDTRTPMLVNLVIYWAVGVPVGYVLCFRLGWGAPGLWLGLCVALLAIGGTLIGVWRRRTRGSSRALRSGLPSPAHPATMGWLPTRRQFWMRLLWATAIFVLVEGALFRTGLYTHVIEPDSSTGLLQTYLRDEKTRPGNGPRQVLAIGNSRMGFRPRAANQLESETGCTFATIAMPGSTPRCWFYMLRDVDPTASRYAAILIGVEDYDDEDYEDLSGREMDIRYVVSMLRWSDAWEFASSYPAWSNRWEALRATLFKGYAYRSDFQDFLVRHKERLRKVEETRRESAGRRYLERWGDADLAGLRVDWKAWKVFPPPGATRQQKNLLEAVLLRETIEQSGQRGAILAPLVRPDRRPLSRLAHARGLPAAAAGTRRQTRAGGPQDSRSPRPRPESAGAPDP